MPSPSLYDQSKNTLSLARDPFGIKPLDYAETSKGFIYASEPQAILATGLVSKELHSEALSDLMHLRYTTSRETIYKGIFRVLPGEMLTVKDGVIVSRSHQDALPKGPPEKIGFYEAMARLDTVLTPSRLTLEAMSPMACTFQVGGVDSSVFLSLMHQEVGAGIRTFTVGFPGTQVHDERASHGRQPMSQRSSAPCIAYSEDSFWAETPQVMAALDDPTLDFATLPTLHMSKYAARDLKVVLCGEGGDEIFSGYARHRRARFFGRILQCLMRKRGLTSWIASMS